MGKDWGSTCHVAASLSMVSRSKGGLCIVRLEVRRQRTLNCGCHCEGGLELDLPRERCKNESGA